MLPNEMFCFGRHLSAMIKDLIPNNSEFGFCTYHLKKL